MKNDQFFFVILNMIGRIFIKPSPRGEGGRRPDEVSTVFPHRLLQIIFSLLLCLSLILPSALAAKNADPDRADIRVSLRRLNLTDAIWMTLEGRYLARCAEGAELLLPAGANVTVFLRNGKLILFPGGISLSAGKKLTFLRQQEGDAAPGIRFNLQQGFYPGDLSLSVKDDSIQAVLTLPLETYLQGVVPYEMSDSFPLEALKAQAVCARTYALSKMNPDADYDVVDTTNDQVFKGLNPEYKNTALAVTSTEGLVLTYKDKLITAWYSASNGGQTELPQHVWGGDDVPACFDMTDDPWDAENPGSLVRKAVLKKDGSNLSPAFLRLLREALKAEPEMKDFDLEDGSPFRVDAIRSMQLTAPRYKKPSRLMTRLEISFSCSAALKPGLTRPQENGDELDIRDLMGEEPTPTPTPTPEPSEGEHVPVSAGSFDISLELFPGVLNALALSISGANNEIVTLTEDDSAFTLASARYGHGVGLSQRGAEYQAKKDNRGFEEILSFYYPGAKLKQYSRESAPLPTPDPALAVTPGPVPTATPRPTLMPVTEDLPEGAWLAEVENIDDDSSLNLRAEASPAAEILMRLFRHQKLIVLENAEVDGWAKVKTDAVEGYVMLSFLQPVP